jgi:hypothetical protein
MGIECDFSIPVWKMGVLGGGPLVLYQGRRVNRTCPWRMERLAPGPDHQGPEGRPPNVSPARKGWVGIPIMIPSAIGAAPILSSTNLRRGGTPQERKAVAFVQSLFSGCEGCNQPSLRSECHSRIPRQKPVTSSAALSPPIGHGCRAYGAPSAGRGWRDHDGDSNPALPGWADVWRAALRALMGLVPETTVPSSTDGLGFHLPGSNPTVSSPSPQQESQTRLVR